VKDPDSRPQQDEDDPLTGHQFGGHQFGGTMLGGWSGDVPDARDQPLLPPVGTALAGGEQPSVDLPRGPAEAARVDWRVPVAAQQPLQSCVSCAVSSVVGHLDLPAGAAPAGPGPSSLFLYYNTRSVEGTGRCDNGSGIRSALKALNRYGVCTEQAWGPAHQFVERPPAEAYENAYYAGSVSYRRAFRLGSEPDALDLGPVRTALANGLPVLFGFAVYDSFRAAGDGAPVPLPRADERVLFGHAAVLVGHDGDAFEAVNSWGPAWGREGRFELPAAYLADRRLAKDFWVITSLGARAAVATPGQPATTA
jgi:hypothetical protein